MTYRFESRIKRPNGKWVSAAATDITKTFERERKRLQRKAAPQANVKENTADTAMPAVAAPKIRRVA